MGYSTRGRARGGTRSGSGTVRIKQTTGRYGTGAAGARHEAMAAEAVTFPLVVGVVHWIIVQLSASLALRFGTARESSPPYKGTLGEPVPLEGLAHVLVEPLRMWDGLWYKLIAEQGYNGTETQTAKAAFWPLFPWLMDGGSRLTGLSVEAAGYIIANLSFLGALMLLYRLVVEDFDRAVARRTLWALALFPTAFFFSAVYTESLFLLLAVGALLAARLGNWWVAGVVGLLAALTRSYGVLLLIPFAVLLIQQYGFVPRRWLSNLNLLAAGLPALGPTLFAFHLRRAGREPDAFITVQEQWFRFSAAPWTTFRCAVSGCEVNLPAAGGNFSVRGAEWGWIGDLLGNPTLATLTSLEFRDFVAGSDTLELVATLLFIGLAIAGLRLLPLYQSAYLIPGLVIPLFGPSAVHPLMSMPRFGLTLFPLFIVLALLIRRPIFVVPVAIGSTLLLVLLTAQFSNWYWVS
ncbi:MAG: hypothetical protein H0T49_02520 [Chloroflexia bacterium]|nr:hypothetical protein [Chloroflexia bacterium]